jgi:hypothetical protein
MRTFFESVDSTTSYNGFATLPYIKGVTEPISRILRKHDIKVCNKPMNTLQREFPSDKQGVCSTLACEVESVPLLMVSVRDHQQKNRQMRSTKYPVKIVCGAT